MEASELRPTFRVQLEYPRNTAVEQIRAKLGAREELVGRWRGKGRWAEIHVPEQERKLWSPRLSLRVDDTGDTSELLGRFEPQAEVWTFFMFVYSAVAFFTILGGIFGYVQWASAEPAWGLWAVWAGVPTIALLHVVSAVGQRLGRQQMHDLRAVVLDIVEEIGG